VREWAFNSHSHLPIPIPNAAHIQFHSHWLSIFKCTVWWCSKYSLLPSFKLVQVGHSATAKASLMVTLHCCAATAESTECVRQRCGALLWDCFDCTKHAFKGHWKYCWKPGMHSAGNCIPVQVRKLYAKLCAITRNFKMSVSLATVKLT